MILLLDAHALIWALADDPSLQSEARDAIRDPMNDVVVSAATIWEIAIKRALGKLEAPPDLVHALEATHFVGLPVTGIDAEQAGDLPLHHRDPFDRMLVAQAQRLGAVLVSRDKVFAAYEVEILPA
jgi:PIN domain nuclease of toxin-antitoxin system